MNKETGTKSQQNTTRRKLCIKPLTYNVKYVASTPQDTNSHLNTNK